MLRAMASSLLIQSSSRFPDSLPSPVTRSSSCCSRFRIQTFQVLGQAEHLNAKSHASKVAGFQGWSGKLELAFKKSYARPQSASPIKASDSSLGAEETSPQAEKTPVGPGFVGEDAAVFEFSKQKLSSWASFSAVLAVVLAILNYVWIDPKTGYGNTFIQAMSSVSDNHEVVMLAILAVFALVHSGLASFRDLGERLVGERAFRVLFAGLSLPLAVSAVVYFIDHRYDGAQLWQVQAIPGIHELVWAMSFISFFFLYPSTFNLLEVAAVDKPKMHMYETGIMRITRHPQMVGQFLWCIAHTLWIGNSFMLTTSFGLLAHHLYGVWNGDRRLTARYGDAFEAVKKRTSIIPFAAVLDGRQKLPTDYYREFLRVPYFTILALTLGAYFGHPLLQAGSYQLNW